MTDETARQHKEEVTARINARLAACRIKAAKASKDAGFSAGLIRDLERKGATPKLETLAQLAPVLRTTPEWLAFGRGVEDIDNAPGREISPGIFALDGDTIPPDYTRVPVQGTLQAGVWREEDDWTGEEARFALFPARRRYAPGALYAAEIRGSSMNKVFPAGTLVILQHRLDREKDLIPGQRYHVERSKPDGTREHTLKTVYREPRDGSIWLVPESTDPAHQDWIQIRTSQDLWINYVGMVVGAILLDNA
ncbi:helix-turn-helix domain-containing protein [Methylobrevis pamukkalensis]|nr:LexA family transcriptional regulator [Methylobrevis pamukkalensis]